MTTRSYGTAPAADDGKRVARRHKIFLPVRMTVADDDLRIHLINVSVTGALAHHATPPIRGTSVGIEHEGRRIDGRIIWSDGRRFGIAFSDRLSEQALQTLIGDRAAGAAPRPRPMPGTAIPSA